MMCAYRPSRHAKDQMIERGISREEAMEVIMKGAKHLKDRNILSGYRRTVVVWRKVPCQFFVLTMYRR